MIVGSGVGALAAGATTLAGGSSEAVRAAGDVGDVESARILDTGGPGDGRSGYVGSTYDPRRRQRIWTGMRASATSERDDGTSRRRGRRDGGRYVHPPTLMQGQPTPRTPPPNRPLGPPPWSPKKKSPQRGRATRPLRPTTLARLQAEESDVAQLDPAARRPASIRCSFDSRPCQHDSITTATSKIRFKHPE